MLRYLLSAARRLVKENWQPILVHEAAAAAVSHCMAPTAAPVALAAALLILQRGPAEFALARHLCVSVCCADDKCVLFIFVLACAGAMGIKGVRVLTFSPFEMKAFGGFGYELKKKVVWHSTNLASTWFSMLPIMSGTYFLIKWAEAKFEADQRSHRD